MTEERKPEEQRKKKPSLSPSSFKVGIVAAGERSMIFNALRFATKEEAESYAEDLRGRWTVPTRIEVAHSFDHPNATFPVPSDRFVFDRTKLTEEDS